MPADEEVKEIELLGSWSYFKTKTKMIVEHINQEQHFKVTIDLVPGIYQYWYIIDGKKNNIDENKPKVSVLGNEVNILTINP